MVFFVVFLHYSLWFLKHLCTLLYYLLWFCNGRIWCKKKRKVTCDSRASIQIAAVGGHKEEEEEEEDEHQQLRRRALIHRTSPQHGRHSRNAAVGKNPF